MSEARSGSSAGVRILTGFAPGAPAALAVLLALGAMAAPRELGGESRLIDDWALLVRLARDWALLARTLGFAALIGALSVALALPAAWALRRVGARWWALLVAPLLLPAPLVYASWGLLRAPGTAMARLVERDAPSIGPLVSSAHAVLGLALWAWPLALIVLAPAALRIDPGAMDALRMSGAGMVRRACEVIGQMRGAVLGAAGLVALVMLGSAAPLHLAQVQTWAIVVWRELDATGGGAGTRAVWLAALPLLVVAAVGGALGARSAGARESDMQREPGGGDPGIRARWIGAAALVWSMSALAPIALMLFNLREARSLARVWAIMGEGARSSALTAAIVLAMTFAVGVVTAVCAARGRGHRTALIARWSVGAWIALALVPGVLVGAALLSASRLDGLRWLGDTRAGVVVAHLVRFGAVGALAGWWLARAEPGALVDQRSLVGSAGLAVWWATVGRAGAPALAGAACACAVLSVGEIESAVILTPPGSGNLARTLLQQLHYLRMEELVAAGAQLMTIGLGVGLLVTMLAGRSFSRWRPSARTSSATLLLAGASLLLTSGPIGCSDNATSADAPGPLRVERVIGEVGSQPGQFLAPRAIDSDGSSLWVIDKTGRVQRVGADGSGRGAFELPKFDRGFPVGVTCGPDGLVYIADTHEHRVLVGRPLPESGGAAGPALELVAQWGDYGMGPGEFIYTTDVAIVPARDGRTPERIYVGEYGGNDRVSVFDADRRFLFSFGRAGSSARADAVEFDRPQALLWDAARSRLYVSDSSNHRIGVFTPDGALLRWVGRAGLDGDALTPGAGGPGRGPGEFNYPYGLALLRDGSLLVVEMGNNRVQRIDPDTGRSLSIAGRPGRAEGELAQPWGVALLGDRAVALDTGNHRALIFDPDRMPPGGRE